MAIFLHIGFPKTATTSLQFAMKRNAAALREAGVCYPLIDKDFKQRYLKYFDIKAENSLATRQMFDDQIAAMAQAIRGSGCKDAILSCEELTNFLMMRFDRSNLERLRDYLHGIDPDVRIVAYVRNPSDFYTSIVQEKLKRSGGVLPWNSFRTNFARIIGLYEEVFGGTAIVREFHRSKLIDGSIAVDFFDAVGLGHVGAAAWEPVRTNESISPDMLLLLDTLRQNRVDAAGPRSREDEEFLWHSLAQASRDLGKADKPVIFRHISDQVMQGNRADIEALNRKYGIDFAPATHVEGEAVVPEPFRLSAIESIMSVDRARAFQVMERALVSLRPGSGGRV